MSHTFADSQSLPVTYAGLNGAGQFLFCNGQSYVTHVFQSLEESVETFGVRIDTRKKEMTYSGPFSSGMNDSLYKRKQYTAQANGFTNQSAIEYGLGYIHGLLSRKGVIQPSAIVETPRQVIAVFTPAPKDPNAIRTLADEPRIPIYDPLIYDLLKFHPNGKKRMGRPKKIINEIKIPKASDVP